MYIVWVMSWLSSPFKGGWHFFASDPSGVSLVDLQWRLYRIRGQSAPWQWRPAIYNRGQKSLGHQTELPLTELPVVSYCYQIIVLSKYSLTPSPLSPQINVELNMYEVFSPTATLSRGEGGWTTFLQGTWYLIIKLHSVPTIFSRIVGFPRKFSTSTCCPSANCRCLLVLSCLVFCSICLWMTFRSWSGWIKCNLVLNRRFMNSSARSELLRTGGPSAVGGARTR